MSGMLLAKNRKAFYNHREVERFTAGMVLKGYEVKALREGNVNFEGAYVQMIKNEPYLVNLHIGKYSKQSQTEDAASTRSMRKLLLTKSEIMEISRELKTKGHTVVPTAIVLEHNLVKLEMAVVKGKKDFEKKQVVKERQIERDMQVEWKEFHRAVDI